MAALKDGKLNAMSSNEARFIPSLDSVAKKLHLPFGVPDFIDNMVKGASNDIGERLIKTMIITWDATGGGPFAVSAAGGLAANKAVDASMDLFLGPVFEQLLRRLGVQDVPFRASLCASAIVGMGTMRWVVRTDPLASAPVDDLVAALAPTLQRYLTGEIRKPAKETPR
ncbi:hypothetical protein SMNI109538_17405 [Smaragdicoccus niigatensis]